jgi:hypothetical protein
MDRTHCGVAATNASDVGRSLCASARVASVDADEREGINETTPDAAAMALPAQQGSALAQPPDVGSTNSVMPG